MALKMLIRKVLQAAETEEIRKEFERGLRVQITLSLEEARVTALVPCTSLKVEGCRDK